MEESHRLAMETFPEMYGHIDMLYIDVAINNQLIKAFVDTGMHCMFAVCRV